MSPAPPTAAPSTQASHTFDQVDFARRRIAELLRESRSVPSLMALADRMARTASHGWCLWVTPRPNLPALLISGEWNLSAFVLQGFYSRVEVWETDAHRAEITARVADEADLNIHVQQCPPTQLADRLRSIGQPYGTGGDTGCSGLRFPGAPERWRREVLHHLAAHDFSRWPVLRHQPKPLCAGSKFGAGFRVYYAPPTPARSDAAPGQPYGQGAHRACSFTRITTIPGEVLFPPERLPRARRDQKLPRITHAPRYLRAHAAGRSHASRRMQRGPLLVDQAAQDWQSRGTGAGGRNACSTAASASTRWCS